MAHAPLFWRTFKDFENSRGWNTTRRGELFEDMIAVRGWAFTRGAKLFRAEGFLNGDRFWWHDIHTNITSVNRNLSIYVCRSHLWLLFVGPLMVKKNLSILMFLSTFSLWFRLLGASQWNLWSSINLDSVIKYRWVKNIPDIWCLKYYLYSLSTHNDLILRYFCNYV